MQNDILFDNIYIGHSVQDALAFQKSTFDLKVASENDQESTKERNELAESQKRPKGPKDLRFLEDPVHYAKEKLLLFLYLARRSPLEAIRFVPEVSGTIGAAIVLVIVIIIGAVAGPKAAPSKAQMDEKTKQAKEAMQKTKDQVADAVATGTEQVKEEVNKRTTRSSAKDSE